MTEMDSAIKRYKEVAEKELKYLARIGVDPAEYATVVNDNIQKWTKDGSYGQAHLKASLHEVKVDANMKLLEAVEREYRATHRLGKDDTLTAGQQKEMLKTYDKIADSTDFKPLTPEQKEKLANGQSVIQVANDFGTRIGLLGTEADRLNKQAAVTEYVNAVNDKLDLDQNLSGKPLSDEARQDVLQAAKKEAESMAVQGVRGVAALEQKTQAVHQQMTEALSQPAAAVAQRVDAKQSSSGNIAAGKPQSDTVREPATVKPQDKSVEKDVADLKKTYLYAAQQQARREAEHGGHKFDKEKFDKEMRPKLLTALNGQLKGLSAEEQLAKLEPMAQAALDGKFDTLTPVKQAKAGHSPSAKPHQEDGYVAGHMTRVEEDAKEGQARNDAAQKPSLKQQWANYRNALADNIAKLTKWADTDHDGKLSQSERATLGGNAAARDALKDNVQKLVKSFDTDGDGILSKNEQLRAAEMLKNNNALAKTFNLNGSSLNAEAVGKQLIAYAKGYEVPLKMEQATGDPTPAMTPSAKQDTRSAVKQ